MTLIIAIPATDGVVMGSDSQVTIGEIRQTGVKIKKLSNYCVWAASGELALIQRVEEDIQQNIASREARLASLRDTLSASVNKAVTSLLNIDFRTQFCGNNPNMLLGLHPGDFVFAEYYDNHPCILHIEANGTAEWVDFPFATGGGASFAYALMQKYQGRQFDVLLSSVLVYKVIEEAINVGSYGLGAPIDIWWVTSNGAHRVSENERQSIEDHARLLRNLEVSLLEDLPKLLESLIKQQGESAGTADGPCEELSGNNKDR